MAGQKNICLLSVDRSAGPRAPGRELEALTETVTETETETATEPETEPETETET